MNFTLLPERPDVLPSGVAPKHVRKFLQRVGGVTPWGENKYRLVIAEHVMLYVGARWHDWRPGAGLLDQGGLEFSPETRKSKYVMRDPTDHSKTIVVEVDVPAAVGLKRGNLERVVAEMRWIRRYPDIEGWLLQAWLPSSYYSHEHYEITVSGRSDLPLLGEFPARGQYERQFFYLDRTREQRETFPTMPGESWMERAIQQHEHAMAERADESPNRDWRMLTTLNELRSAREHYQQQERAKLDDRIKERIAPIFSSSLAGGRIREQLAQRCREQGIVLGHVGN